MLAACGSQSTSKGYPAAVAGGGGDSGKVSAAAGRSGADSTSSGGSGGMAVSGGMTSFGGAGAEAGASAAGAGGRHVGASAGSGEPGGGPPAGGAAAGSVATGGGGAGSAGSPGGSGGGKSLGTPGVCTFQIDGAPSSAIPTVGVVNWTTDLAGLTAASIEFSLDDAPPDTINTGSGGAIDVTGTAHRALMLGLKPQKTYTYRIVAKAGATTCTSADQSLTTGANTGAPTVVRKSMKPSAQAKGFIVTSSGYNGLWKMAYILDADGETVWWSPAPSDCTRALMDWEGANMWMVNLNPTANSDGSLMRVGMDGTGSETVDGFEYAHHDITVAPGGIVTALVWSQPGYAAPSDLVERSPDGTLHTVAEIGESIVKSQSNGEHHANSVLYHPTDDSYTVSDLYAFAYVKLTRQGTLEWQFGGDCSGAPAPKCATANTGGQHGHQLLDSGHMLFFDADTGTSPVFEYSLAETATSLTVSEVWTYSSPGLGSDVLGDVQRLPNGDTLIDYCMDGYIYEVSPSGDLVQTLRADSKNPPVGNYPPPDTIHGNFGYLNYRETLYGAPIR